MSRQKGVRDYHGPGRPDKASLGPDELPTPSVAIRCFCLACLGWEPGEVRHCEGKLVGGRCPFHKLRMGGRRGTRPLQAIRQVCLACMGGHAEAVRGCHDTRCPLWPFRFGANPRTNRRARSRFEAETAARKDALSKNGSSDGSREPPGTEAPVPVPPLSRGENTASVPV